MKLLLSVFLIESGKPTGTLLSEPDAALIAPASPAEVVAVLLTVDGEPPGTFTTRLRVGKLEPEASMSVESVQVTVIVVVPAVAQLQFVPELEANV